MGEETAHHSDRAAQSGGIRSGELTQILADLRHGNAEAGARLVSMVYDDLRELATGQLRRERGGHTLQPTALVHEAFLRLFGREGSTWENRAHFFGAAAEAMRRVLVDYARRRQALKRGAGAEPLELNDDAAVTDKEAATVLAVDEALSGLAAHDTRKRTLVELRYFVGLTLEEAADVLGISPATAKRDWAFAKAWLFRELGDKSGDLTSG